MIPNFSFTPYGELFKFVSFDDQSGVLGLRSFSGVMKGRIAVLIHGYLGSAKDLAQLASFLKNDLSIGVNGERYDSILFYQYNTLPSIVDIALQFNADLEELKYRGQSIDIYAHSMGGLVSRWWIEQLGGGRFVQRLITFGTPHAGVSLSKYEKWGHLLQEKIPLQFSLKDMVCITEESLFLRKLNEPHSKFVDQVDYYSIAGSKWTDFLGFGNLFIHTLLKNEEQMDGLVHISSAHSVYLESKSFSWNQFTSQRATFELNHLELLGIYKPMQNGREIQQPDHLPFVQIQKWAMEWK